MTDSPKDPETTKDQDATDDAWAEAMAEQSAAETEAATESDDGASHDDNAAAAAWAEALAEQREDRAEAKPEQQDKPAASSQARNAGDTVFKPLADESRGTSHRDLDMIMEIPVTLSVELGSTRLSIRELLDLAKGSIVELDGLAGEPMNILVNGYLVAQGEVVVVEDKYGIRVTEIVDRAERIGKLNR